MKKLLLTVLSMALFASPLVSFANTQLPDDFGNGIQPGVYCPQLSSTFQKGARDSTTGGQVSELQSFLTDYYNLPDGALVGGYFGKLTQQYIIQFQTEQSLPAFGIVGMLTRAKIASVCGDNSKPPPPPPPYQSWDCNPTAHAASLGLNSFYKKTCVVGGIPVISSAQVSDAALQEAARIIKNMLDGRSDIVAQLVAHNLRVGVIGANEQTTSLPEYANLSTTFPSVDWNTRTRGLGATIALPLASGAEENLLCSSNDRYRGENIFVHEFGHTVKDLGVSFLDSSFNTKLDVSYQNAIANGLWKNTYAATNKEEYWAEGVQDYFDTNAMSDPPNGVHNTIHTRDGLKSYDPGLYTLIASVFPTTWRYSCPQTTPPLSCPLSQRPACPVGQHYEFGQTVYGPNNCPMQDAKCVGDIASSTSTISVVTPNGGEELVYDQSNTITWKTANIGSVSVALYMNDKFLTYILQSAPAGVGTTGYSWTPSHVIPPLDDLANQNFRIVISGQDALGQNITDKSDAPFNIHMSKISALEASLSINSKSFAPGDIIQVTWSNPTTKAKDWLGLAYLDSDWTDSVMDFRGENKGWLYTGPKTSDNRTLIAPSTAGQYQVVYYSSDSGRIQESTVIARSPAFTVSAPITPPSSTSISINVSATNFIKGDAGITGSWSNPAGATIEDWIGVVPNGTSNTDSAGHWVWVTTNTTTQGTSAGATSGAITISAPLSAGQYQLVYYLNQKDADGKWIEKARSGPFTVSTSASALSTEKNANLANALTALQSVLEQLVNTLGH